MRERRGLAPTVAVARQGVSDRGPAAERALVDDLVFGARAVNISRAHDAQAHAAAQEVVLAQVDAARIGAARTARAQAGVERPGVARLDFDVDHALAQGNRADHHFAQVTCAAQHAFGLVDQTHRHRLAAAEQQCAPHHAFLGLDVQLVGPAKQQLVLLRIFGSEDVARLNADRADDRPGGLEFGQRGQGRGRRLLGGCAKRDQTYREPQQPARREPAGRVNHPAAPAQGPGAARTCRAARPAPVQRTSTANLSTTCGS